MTEVICVDCKSSLGTRPGPAGPVSHSICEQCMEKRR